MKLSVKQQKEIIGDDAIRKAFLAREERKWRQYDRSHFSYRPKSSRKICCKCRFVSQRNLICGNCGGEMIVMDFFNRARPPRKKASKRKWRDFIKRFNLGVEI